MCSCEIAIWQWLSVQREQTPVNQSVGLGYNNTQISALHSRVVLCVIHCWFNEAAADGDDGVWRPLVNVSRTMPIGLTFARPAVAVEGRLSCGCPRQSPPHAVRVLSRPWRSSARPGRASVCQPRRLCKSHAMITYSTRW